MTSSFLNVSLKLLCLLLSILQRTTRSLDVVRNAKSSSSRNAVVTEKFSIPLINERQKPEKFLEKLQDLWNDPRPVTTSLSDTLGGRTNQRNGNDGSGGSAYCVISDEFQVCSHKFRVLLYPRGRFVSSSSSLPVTGPASAYLRYVPANYGDEVDITWKIKLVDTRSGNALPIVTSGGLPRSNDTFSCGMTFCSELEDIESLGRAADWGSSSWFADSVCDALGHIEAQGEITLYDSRVGESSFSLQPKGAIAAVFRSAAEASNTEDDRTFRVGEVIVPIDNKDDRNNLKSLEESFILPGTDYRIMTMTDKDGNPIFSTSSLPKNERKDARLALRPCGWKLQRQLWQQRGMKTDWPVEVDAGLLSSTALTRFNPASAFPRVVATFKRDTVAVLLGLALAISPLPLALFGRNFVSLYAIPSASMTPTLQKGDVLLVEKFPGTFDRTSRGDVVLFSPPSALREIIGDKSVFRGNSLFVKRVVGLPGDKDIVMETGTNEVKISDSPAVGPDRNLCEDEPLRLIERLLDNGKGKSIEQLGEDDVYVLGDCKAVSVDSRVFGVLPKQNVVGRPIARIWPLSRLTLGPL